jgi:hypothetical protein
VPVVAGAGAAAVSIITDRDLCMAAYTRGKPLGELRVRDTMSATCAPAPGFARAAAWHDARAGAACPSSTRGQLLGIVAVDIARIRASRERKKASSSRSALLRGSAGAPARNRREELPALGLYFGSAGAGGALPAKLVHPPRLGSCSMSAQ